jgi:hypothetical protein
MNSTTICHFINNFLNLYFLKKFLRLSTDEAVRGTIPGTNLVNGDCLFHLQNSRLLGVSLLKFGTQVGLFKSSRNLRIFRGEELLSAPSLEEEVKPSVSFHTFAECKRIPKVTWKSPFSPT